MTLTLFSARDDYPLAHAVASRLGISPGRLLLEHFPDGEIHVEIRQEIQGHDVYLIQPTGPPVAEHLLQLLLLADACQRAGASRLTGVIPYFGYARQDHRARSGEPVGAKLIADLLGSRIQRIVTVDLHTPAIEGFFTVPVEHLSAVPLLVDALRAERTADQVIVAPDLGAAKLARQYGENLDLPVAYVDKVRLSGHEVSVRSVIGEIEGRSPVLVDDMISTGGTMISAIKALLEKGCRPDILVAASHALLTGSAGAELNALPVRKIVTTDSVPPPSGVMPMEVVSLDQMLAAAVSGLHGERQNAPQNSRNL